MKSVFLFFLLKSSWFYIRLFLDWQPSQSSTEWEECRSKRTSLARGPFFSRSCSRYTGSLSSHPKGPLGYSRFCTNFFFWSVFLRRHTLLPVCIPQDTRGLQEICAWLRGCGWSLDAWVELSKRTQKRPLPGWPEVGG